MSEMALDAVLSHPYYEDDTVREAVADQCIDYDTLSAALPDESVIVPPEGDWILLREQPTTAIPDPPLYSMWRARPVYHSRRFKRVLAGSRLRTLNWPLLRARIVTPYGELTLLPREYIRVTKLREWIDQIGNGVTLNIMGPGDVEAELNEKVFYLQSRGLRRVDALLLLLPEVTDQAFAWMSLDGTGAEEYIEGAKSDPQAAPV